MSPYLLVYVLAANVNNQWSAAMDFVQSSNFSLSFRRNKLKRELSTSNLSLRELESRPSPLLTIFLTLFLTRIPRHQPRFFQGRAKIRIVFHQSTRDAVSNRPGLSGCAAAIDIDKNVKFIDCLRQAKRLTNDHL